MDKRERLAKYAHDAWSGWMLYLFNNSTYNKDDTITIPKRLVARWMRQVSTKYNDLPDEEKKSDLEEADKIMFIIASSFIKGEK